MSNKADMSTIGGRLRELRESRGLTQDDVARIVRYSRQNINKFENASDEEISLKSDVLIRYAKYFDVSTDYILGLDGDHKKKSTSELGLPLGLDEKSVLALQILKKLNLSDLNTMDDPFGYLQDTIENEKSFTQKGINLLLTLLYDDLIEAKSEKNTPGRGAGTIGNLFSHIYMYINAIRFGLGKDYSKIKMPHFVFNNEQASPFSEMMVIKYADGGFSAPFHACELFWAYYSTKILNDIHELIVPYDRRFAREYNLNLKSESEENAGGKKNGKHTAKRK